MVLSDILVLVVTLVMFAIAGLVVLFAMYAKLIRIQTELEELKTMLRIWSRYAMYFGED